MPSLRTLRFTGLLYLGLAVLGVVGLKLIPSMVVIRDDPIATVANLRAFEGIFRTGIAIELVGQTLFALIPLALYRVFRNTSAELAALMVILALISVPISLVAVGAELGATWGANGSALLAITSRPELDALALTLLRVHGQLLVVAGVLWGLWLVPLAVLELRTAFVPRLVGVLVMIAGFGYVIDALVAVVAPAQASALGGFASVAEAGELATILWLLFAMPRHVSLHVREVLQ